MSELAHRLRRGDRAGPGPGPGPLPVEGRCVAIAVDTMIERVHFDERTGPEDLGHKVLAVNLSDLAAMGATPLAGILTLSAGSERLEGAWIERFARGLLALADEHRLRWRGAVTACGALAATVEVTGGVGPEGGLRRAGARPGDEIYVSGTLGDAGGALALAGEATRAEDGRHLLARLLRPTPRIALGQAARGLASSAIDLSDGLGSDLEHVLVASRASATVDTRCLPLSPALRRAVGPARAVELALSAGDDYELVLTVAPERAAALRERARALACPLTRIGAVDAAGAPGRVRWLDAEGRQGPAPRGYAHFS